MFPIPTGRVAACLIALVLAVAAGSPAAGYAQTHVRTLQTHV
jgi:hypothetical protein